MILSDQSVPAGKVECFSVEDNGVMEVLHSPEQVVLSGETICKVVQRH